MSFKKTQEINHLSTSKSSTMVNGYMPSRRAWINKAKSDLHLAKKGIKDDDLTLDTAIYHRQECAEKAPKGFLTYHGIPLVKTHDLLKLLENCCLIDSDFSNLSLDAAVFSSFATEFRYPAEDQVIIERK